MSESANLVLGIDIGTTSVKVVIVDRLSKEVLDSSSADTKAYIKSNIGYLGKEQDPSLIFQVLDECVLSLKETLRHRVSYIAVSGQMHGIIMWKKISNCELSGTKINEIFETSNLFTWEDMRCSRDFLNSLTPPDSHLNVASGFGCVTLLWLLQFKPSILNQYNCSGTIHDFLVYLLCRLDRPVISEHNAASWGYFDTVSQTWNVDIIQSAGLPLELLPTFKKAGSIVGCTNETWNGIAPGTFVAVAMGDLQCSIYSRLQHETDAVLNISTSAQLSFVMPNDYKPMKNEQRTAIENVPYFDGRYLAEAASLNGGNVITAFVDMLHGWLTELGFEAATDRLWCTINQFSQTEDSTDTKVKDSCVTDDIPVVNPIIYGERHMNEIYGSVINIRHNNTSLQNVFRGICRGLVANLVDMMPPEKLVQHGITRIIGSGTALCNNKILQQEIQKQYKVELVLNESCGLDSAVGAARYIIDRHLASS